MIQQQRQQLAMMGIDVWIPRHMAARTLPGSVTCWRDQDLGKDQTPSISVQPVTAKIEIKDPKVIQPIKQEIQKPVQQQVLSQAASVVVTAQAEPVQAFQLQALVAEKFVLFTDQLNLNTETLALWRNIQAALSLQDAGLQWPFPLANLQDTAGLSDYVQGFLDVVAAEKTIFCFGSLPAGLTLEHQQLASLADMLQQPLLKQQLWKLIQPLRL